MIAGFGMAGMILSLMTITAGHKIVGAAAVSLCMAMMVLDPTNNRSGPSPYHRPARKSHSLIILGQLVVFICALTSIYIGTMLPLPNNQGPPTDLIAKSHAQGGK